MEDVSEDNNCVDTGVVLIWDAPWVLLLMMLMTTACSISPKKVHEVAWLHVGTVSMEVLNES